MMRNRGRHSAPRRRTRISLAPLVLALLVAVAVAGTRPAAAGEKPAYASWFRYDADALQSWRFSEVEGDPYQVAIRPSGGVTRGKSHKIFVIYPRPSSAYDIAITRILETFAEKNIRADFSVFNFRKNDARGRAGLRLAEAGGYELIFSMGSESTAWLFRNYIGGALPVVSVTSKDPVMLGQAASYDTGSGSNFAFTSLNMPIEAQMSYVLDLKPRLKNIGILVDSKNVSAVQTQAEPMVEFARQRGIRVLYLAVSEPGNARRELATMVSDAVKAMRKNDPDLENSVFWITGSTSVFREIATINEHADRVPVLSVAPEVVRSGADSAVLSVGISFQSNAHLAAIYGAEVLSGEAVVGQLPVGVVSPPDIAINFLKAREIGLKIPFGFIESASFIYDYDGRQVRDNGRSVAVSN